MVEYACIVLEWVGFLFCFAAVGVGAGVAAMLGLASVWRGFLRGVERFGELE